jgi:ankyrin repeat protein
MKYTIIYILVIVLAIGCKRANKSYPNTFTNEVYRQAADYAIDDDAEKLNQWIIENHIDVNGQTIKRGFTLLHIAVANLSENAVRVLLQHGADPNLKDDDSLSPLMASCSKYIKLDYNTEITKMLIEAGGNVNDVQYIPRHYPPTQYKTPLMYAAKGEDIKTVELLIKYGADINYYTEYYGCGTLQSAIIGGNMELVELLIKKYNIDIPDYILITIGKDTLTTIELLESSDNLPNINHKLRLELIEYLKSKGYK